MASSITNTMLYILEPFRLAEEHLTLWYYIQFLIVACLPFYFTMTIFGKRKIRYEDIFP